MQLYVRQNNIGSEEYEFFKEIDMGDIVGAEGVLFRTKSGELSVNVSKISLLVKSIRPLPDKHHGLQNKYSFRQQKWNVRTSSFHFRHRN